MVVKSVKSGIAKLVHNTKAHILRKPTVNRKNTPRSNQSQKMKKTSDAVVGSFVEFDLVSPLGTLIIPDDYVYETSVAAIRARYNEPDIHMNSMLTDAHFNGSKELFTPGTRYKVSLIKVSGSTSTRKCVDFLKSKRCVWLGPQGLDLMYAQFEKVLPRAHRLMSFDVRFDEYKDHYRVPYLAVHQRALPEFRLAYASGKRAQGDYLVCFQKAR